MDAFQPAEAVETKVYDMIKLLIDIATHYIQATLRIPGANPAECLRVISKAMRLSCIYVARFQLVHG
ncbi:hypothetical protein FVE85_9439 [Porphyridium purpureum]|uniref:Uncharacterized protein n=1 Tax=Porphyridium purpureum TaxID=35688 RepID=A0A5J4YK56_PORPP|nr:hypothetical protein FVE85_9439 [Porphyridium purpureum]|eukprot:POR2115..scf261_15